MLGLFSAPPVAIPLSGSSSIDVLFLLAGAYNVVGIAVVSHFFRSPYFGRPFEPDDPKKIPDPLFNFNGVVAVILWGLAFAAAGVDDGFRHVPLLSLVFAIEKSFYVFKYTKMMLPGSELKQSTSTTAAGKRTRNVSMANYWGLPHVVMQSRDFLAIIFYSLYGVGDAIFMVGFLAKYLQSTS